jgi:hypothetical protein
MKKIFVISLLVLMFALSSLAQETCTRVTETAGGFSYCSPAGWTVGDSDGERFKVVWGPRSTVFTANINVQPSTSTAPLGEFTDAAVKAILGSGEKLGATSIALVSRGEFVTDSKKKGSRLEFRTEFKGLWLSTFLYVFDAGSGKLIVTGTTLESEKAANEKLFDAAMKTFQINK